MSGRASTTCVNCRPRVVSYVCQAPSVIAHDESFFQKFLSEVQQVMELPTECVMCHNEGSTRICTIVIPHFKETVVMAFVCEHCGYRNNEVKAGGAVSKFGRRYELSVRNGEDMTRDVLKSDTSTLFIPEIDLHLTQGTLGGRFTTVEGLLTMVRPALYRAAPH